MKTKAKADTLLNIQQFLFLPTDQNSEFNFQHLPAPGELVKRSSRFTICTVSQSFYTAEDASRVDQRDVDERPISQESRKYLNRWQFSN